MAESVRYADPASAERVPKITDADSARRAASEAAAAAALQAAAVLVIIVLNQTRVLANFFDLNLWNLFDVGLLGMLAWFIHWKASRVAALIALAVWLGNQVVAVSEAAPGMHYNIVPAILFGLAYVAGVRGTFLYHAYECAELSPDRDVAVGRVTQNAWQEFVSWAWPKTADREGARRAGLQGVIIAVLGVRTPWLNPSGTPTPLARNVFQYLTGLPSYPDATSLRRFLLRAAPKALPKLRALHDRFLHRFTVRPWPQTRAILDVDSTVLVVYGKQEQARIRLQPHQARATLLPSAALLRGPEPRLLAWGVAAR